MGVLSPLSLFSISIDDMEFIDTPVRDVLLTLGEIGGLSILPDETVGGTTTFRFGKMEVEEALRLFAARHHLYLEEREGIIYVSRVRISLDEGGTLSVDAEDVSLPLLLRKLMQTARITLLYDPLPSDPVTIHTEHLPLKRTLEILVARFPQYKVEENEGYLYIKRIPETSATTSYLSGSLRRDEEGRYSCDIRSERLSTILLNLFSREQKECIFLFDRDPVIEHLRLSDKTFEELLTFILAPTDIQYFEREGIYYFFSTGTSNPLQRFSTSLRIPLTYITPKELLEILPPGLLRKDMYAVDTRNNAIILMGPVVQIDPLVGVIRSLDTPTRKEEYVYHRFSYIRVKEISEILSAEVPGVEIIPLPDERECLLRIPPSARETFQKIVALIDRPGSLFPVSLRHLSLSQLQENLPPEFSKEELIQLPQTNTVLFRGTTEKYRRLRAILEEIDRPFPQIRYHLLVVQHSRNESLNFNQTEEPLLSLDNMTESEREVGTYVLGNFGKLLDLNLDVVSTLGYQFALRLNTELLKNNARVLADTMLVGLSGEEVRFQNTDTFRYREFEITEEGTVTPTGLVREITAGLIFTIEGNVRGEDQLDLDIKATISKRRTDTASDLPSTSENVIDTHIRATHGKPIVLGGLIRYEAGEDITQIPVLGDIPLLGLLFQAKTERITSTELTIYLVPYIERGETRDPILWIERLYKKFFTHSTAFSEDGG